MLLLLLSAAVTCAAQNPLAKLAVGHTKTAESQKAAAAKAAEPAPPGPAPTEQAVNPLVILLPDVAMRSQQLVQTLRDISATLPSAEQLADMNSSVVERGTTLDDKRKEADALLAGTPSSIELREQENYWRGMQAFTVSWRKQLLDWANAGQSAIDQLNKLEPQWSATLEVNQNQAELEPVVDLLRENLAAIRKLRKQATDELQLVVKMQIATGAQDQMVSDVLSRLIDAQESFQDHVLQRDSLPLWQLSARRTQGEDTTLYSNAKTRWIAISAFLSQRRGAILLIVLLALFSLGLAYRLRNSGSEGQPVSEQQAEAIFLLRRWVALGVLPPLLLGYVLAPSAPLPLIGLAILFSFFPILRLLAPVVHRRYRLMLYCLAGFFAFNAVLGWVSLPPVLKRELSFVINSALFLLFVYMLRPSRLSKWRDNSFATRVLVLSGRIAIIALGISLTANLLGHMRLAQFVGLGCTYSAFIAISMYTGMRVFRTLLLTALSLPQSERIAAVRLHRQGLLRWIPRILMGGAFLVWLAATLDLFRMRDQVINAIGTLLDFRLAGSATNVTLGGVLGFFFMLAVGYLIASTVRFLLREEVLSRFHLTRGLPDLIASTVYYLLLLLVFLGAVNAGGVELNKFTLLTGALGVGVGFGLQNIINNFVSGLILQFERPIHINDVLEVDGQTGKVSRIGVRSSTLTTAQGAEVIIPNANLISGKVTNWTLTEAKRRGELPVGVAYGTDSELVVKLLLNAANMHESVLTDPPPAAYFIGFGDSSLNYELHFWVMQDSNWIRVKSDIALVVMKSLENEGIEIPFPQRDLHVRSVEGSTSPLLLQTSAAPLTGKNGTDGALDTKAASQKTASGNE